MNSKTLILLCLLCSLATATTLADEPTSKTDLHVGIFMYLPNASSAIERLEKTFEESEAGKDIDVDFELFDPYSSADDIDKFRNKIASFDLVEIDLVRLDDLLGADPVIEQLPSSVVYPAEQFVSGAVTVASSSQAKYLLPHWVCGQYFVQWEANDLLKNARTFSDILNALDYNCGRPLLADMAGSTGLGEFYADAVLDIGGEQFARDHFAHLRTLESVGPNDLFQEARFAVRSLFCEIAPEVRNQIGYLHDEANHVFPTRFTRNACSALIGYSERLYYVQRELSLSLDPNLRKLEKGELLIRQFPFSNSSKGTPTWVDGFVIPKGKLGEKEKAIEGFLKFVSGEDGYEPFVVPAAWPPTSSYLLPAHVNGYSDSLVEKQPIIEEYRNASNNPFTMNESSLWRSIRRVGKALEADLGIE